MTAFDISVIIPTYNGIELLKRTLTGLESQNANSPSFEVIVVDDGSTDGTSAFLKGYNGKLNIRALTFPKNRGRSAARNAAIDVASGRLILFLDGDMDSPSDLITSHVAAHTDPDQAIIGRVRFERGGRLRGYSRYWEGRGAQRNEKRGEVLPRYFLSGHSSLPTDLARKVGGFDEEIDFYGEDIDFGLGIAAAGAKVIYDPNISTVHLHQRSLSSILKILQEYGRRTIPILVRKHPQLQGDLGIDWGMKRGVVGWIRRSMLAAPVYYPLLWIGVALDWLGIASSLFTYLGYRSYFCGYQSVCSSSKSSQGI